MGFLVWARCSSPHYEKEFFKGGNFSTDRLMIPKGDMDVQSLCIKTRNIFS